jgi:hypothetical protein
MGDQAKGEPAVAEVAAGLVTHGFVAVHRSSSGHEWHHRMCGFRLTRHLPSTLATRSGHRPHADDPAELDAGHLVCPLVGRAPHVVMNAQAGDAVVNDVQGLVGVAVIAVAGDLGAVEGRDVLGDRGLRTVLAAAWSPVAHVGAPV